ncbi:hypothetical protein GBAR_LOCUS19115 [Geodia barretti]|uniref:Uncharacterized protein n=1 Tax=Geodia barretti TaxID=519541 RepID=A0AA35SS26_GEOBA|nr:hypothetical protein GBAR_LOCUS19115 [Geodia barretti]
MASNSFSNSSTSTQLWAVNSEGSVYVLQDVGAWLSSVRSNEVLHGAGTTPHADNWTTRDTVDGRFDRVVCGAGGLVCAKRDKILYIRRGVTYDNPLGTAWTKALCDARDLSVGRDCIVRRTSKDQLFMADSLDLSSSGSVFLPHWDSVPSCEAVETHQMFTLDSRDNLFLLSPSSGEVHICPNLTSSPSQDLKWRKLTDGPPAAKNQSLSLLNILGWRKSGSKTNTFTSVTSGDSCLWCLGSDGRDVFQLVLNYGRNSGRKRKSREGEGSSTQLLDIEGSWKRFELPEKDEATVISADWTELDVFYGLVKENRSIVSYAVLQESRAESRYPIQPEPHSDGNQSRYVSCPNPMLRTSAELEKMHCSSHYIHRNPTPRFTPNSPAREDFDVCCEDGDCEFCRSQSTITSGSWLSGIDEEEEEGVLTESSEEGEGGGVTVSGRSSGEEGPPASKKRKSHRSGTAGEGRGKKQKRENGDLCGEEGSLAWKRPRVPVIDQLANVPFMLSSPPQSHFLAQHQVPLYRYIDLTYSLKPD